MDVGLAQARVPLNTTCHYFEMEIVDPGRSGYITIGLTKKVCLDRKLNSTLDQQERLIFICMIVTVS